MDDWLQELEPLAQQALQKARDAVRRRRGETVSVEDFLLALLEYHPSLTAFLSGQGVALDELIRTIQCEQPVVAPSSETAGLSVQLIDWLATAREIVGQGPLRVSQLLRVLSHRCERLSQRAYVAVLEQVSEQAWPGLERTRRPRPEETSDYILPLGGAGDDLLPASENLLFSARRLTAQLLTEPSPIVHIQTHSSIIARSMVARMREELWRLSGASVEGCRVRVGDFCRDRNGCLGNLLQRDLPLANGCQLVVLEGTTPELLEAFLRKEGVMVWQALIGQRQVVPVLVSRPATSSRQILRWLEAQFDRPVVTTRVPPLNSDDVLAYLRGRQPLLEGRVNMSITADALFIAAAHSTVHEGCPQAKAGSDSAIGAEPERAESILRASAAMLQAERVCGNTRLSALQASWQRRRREELVALARPDEAAATSEDEDFLLELAAEEVDWLEGNSQAPVLDGVAVRRYLEG